jgi:hypothetical protein
MDTMGKIIESKIDSNRITLRDHHGLVQDMRNYLKIHDSIFYKNCSNIKLTLKSKINKITLKGCSDMELDIAGLVTGIEILHSDQINIKSNNPLNSIIISKSENVTITTPKSDSTYKEIVKCQKINIKN